MRPEPDQYGVVLPVAIAGQRPKYRIDKVAGPVGEALIMTALGLAVAIPAAFGYNALVRGNKSIIAKLNKFGFDLHALFVTGARSRAWRSDGQRSSWPRSRRR